MISSETIIVNSKIKNVFVLCYYDGVKEVVSMDERTIYLWYDYLDDASGEYWFEISSSTEQVFVDYLSNRIGIRELIDDSIVFMCNRRYEKYSEIQRIGKIDDFDGIELPENELLGYDFWEKFYAIKVKRMTFTASSIKMLRESRNHFIQFIESDMKQHFKEIEASDAQDEYFYPIAA